MRETHLTQVLGHRSVSNDGGTSDLGIPKIPGGSATASFLYSTRNVKTAACVQVEPILQWSDRPDCRRRPDQPHQGRTDSASSTGC